jgi:hypothetical protein
MTDKLSLQLELRQSSNRTAPPGPAEARLWPTGNEETPEFRRASSDTRPKLSTSTMKESSQPCRPL